MDDQIDDEHVKYENGSLLIDDEAVELPEGKNLSVKYKMKNGVVSYSVKVDGEPVADEEYGTEH